MEKNYLKLLSLFLVLCMLAGLSPIPAHASGNESATEAAPESVTEDLPESMPVDDPITDDDNAGLVIRDELADNSADFDVMLTKQEIYSTAATNGISLNYSTINLVVGSTRTLTAATIPSGRTVTWQTNNDASASVSSSGLVTAKRPGTVTITASFTDSSGVKHSATCKVYVLLANGFYRFKNKLTGLYMQTSGGCILYNTNVNLNTTQNIASATPMALGQLWRVCHLGQGCYSIRPMHNPTMGLFLHASSNAAVRVISTSDSQSNVDNSAEWHIQASSQGHVFKPYTKDGTYAVQVASGSTAPGSNIEVAVFSSSLNNHRWDVEKVTASFTKVVLYDAKTGHSVTNPKKFVAPEDILTPNLTPVLCSNLTTNQNINWKSSNSSLASVNSSSGKVTGVALGTTTICAYQSVNGVEYSTSYTVKVLKDYSLMFIGSKKNDDRMPDMIELVETTLADNGYSQGWGSVSLTKKQLDYQLKNCSVFACFTHGKIDAMQTYDDVYRISDVNSISSSDLDGLHFALLCCCEAGKGKETGNNLVNAFYDKGVDVVLGFTNEVDTIEAYIWTQSFMRSLAAGNTVAAAITDANGVVAAMFSQYYPGKERTITNDTIYIAGSIYAIPFP